MKEEILAILNADTDTFYEYLFKSLKIKRETFGNFIETCSILNAKSGKCPADCKFCAQSLKYRIDIKTYPLLKKETLINTALENFRKGIDRFSFVTSGISLTKEEVKLLGEAIEELKGINSEFKICASLGQLKREDLKYLKSCGLDRYHHNLETSREFYPEISELQNWEDRVRTVINAKEVGLSTCCGGIFGIGETNDDIVSLIETLREIEVDSIPVNFLHPIKGTPLENANYLTPLKCLKILTAVRFGFPKAEIRVCGGREYNLRELQPLSLLPANALMVGNYLTTKGRRLEDDARMIKDMGMESSLKCSS